MAIASVLITAVFLFAISFKDDHPFQFGVSLWFVLTTLTPQGCTVDLPNSAHGRLLGMAFWAFVALLLSTFTSNLSAWYTIERLSSGPQDLKELADFPEYSFSVVKNSPYHDYLKSMAASEKKLLAQWNNLVQKSSFEDEARE